MGFYKKLLDYKPANKSSAKWKPEYKKFRVKSSIKSFRDLEVYKQTTQLSVEIFQFELPETIKNRKKLTAEIEILYEQIFKKIPNTARKNIKPEKSVGQSVWQNSSEIKINFTG